MAEDNRTTGIKFQQIEVPIKGVSKPKKTARKTAKSKPKAPAPVTTAPGERAYIASFQINNFKGVSFLEGASDGSPVMFSGRTEAGKSSAAEAIAATIWGKKYQPEGEVIKRGEDSAQVLVRLSNGFTVEKVWKTKRKDPKTGTLVVKGPDGGSHGQAKLDDMTHWLGVDAFEFDRQDAAQRREIGLQVVGVDLSEFNTRRDEIYARRTLVNNDRKTALARVGDPIKGAPEKPVELETLRQEAAAARAEIGKNAQAEKAAAIAEADARRLGDRVTQLDGEIGRLEELLSDARRKRADAEVSAKDIAARAAELRTAAGLLEDPDLEAIEAKAAEARQLNELHRLATERGARQVEADEHGKKSKELTEQIKAIEAEKIAALASAEWPIEGLGADDNDLTWNGHPYSGQSKSRRLRIAVAFVARVNPELNVALVWHGNDMDEPTYLEFCEQCKAEGLQPLVERISPVGDGAIVIEAGRRAS